MTIEPPGPGTLPGRGSETGRRSVLLADLGARFGGAVVSGLTLARALGDLGYRVTMVSAVPPDVVGVRPGGAVEIRQLRQGVDYMRLRRWEAVAARYVPRQLLPPLGYLLVLVQILGNLPYAMKLALLARQVGADILHANNGPDLSMALAARLAGAHLVIHLRGPYSASRTGGFAVRNARAFVAISKHVKGSAIMAGLCPDRVITLHNPVEAIEPPADEVARVRLELGGGPGLFLVGSVGRILPWKGQREFLLAVEPLLAELPDLRVVFVGDEADSTAGYLEELRDRVVRSGLGPRLTFAGFRTDTPAVFAALDLMVHSAIEPEPFGRVLVEAMVQATPVLAAHAGGPLEILTDGSDGFLRDPRDLSAVRDVIRWCYHHRGEAHEIGRRGQRTAHDRFSPSTHAVSVSAVYDAVLDVSSPQG